MRPVTICGPGNGFIMVLPTHGSQKQPQGEKQPPEKCLSEVWERPSKKQLKAFSLPHQTTSILKGEEHRFHHLQLIRVTGVTLFSGGIKRDYAVTGEQPPALRSYGEGMRLMGPMHSVGLLAGLRHTRPGQAVKRKHPAYCYGNDKANRSRVTSSAY